MKYIRTNEGHTLHFSHNVLAFLYIVLGLVLLLRPAELTRVFCAFVGITALLYGAVKLFSYYRRKDLGSAFQLDLIVGVFLLVIGLLSLIKPAVILSILPVVFGIVVLLDAVGIFRRAFDLRRLDFEKWWISLICAAGLMVFGLILITNPFGSTLFFIRFFGVALFMDGCSDLWGNLQYNKYIRL